MTTFAAETKWADGAHYEKLNGEWVATGVHLERFTNTPRRGEPVPTYAATPRAPGAPDMSDPTSLSQDPDARLAALLLQLVKELRKR